MERSGICSYVRAKKVEIGAFADSGYYALKGR